MNKTLLTKNKNHAFFIFKELCYRNVNKLVYVFLQHTMRVQYNGICLSGGGSKGYYQLGALHYLVSENILNLANCKYFAGTSVGALICVCLIMGIEPLDIFQHVCQFDINHIFEAPSLQQIWQSFGVIPLQRLYDYILDMIVLKRSHHIHIPTFVELKEQYNILFVCTALRIDPTTHKQHKEYFDYTTYPTLNILQAACFSACIPFVFTKTIYRGFYWIDGGIFDNMPLDALLKICPLDCRVLTLRTKSNVKEQSSHEFTFMQYFHCILHTPIGLQHGSKHESNDSVIELDCNANGIDLVVDTKTRMDFFCNGNIQMKHKWMETNKIKTD